MRFTKKHRVLFHKSSPISLFCINQKRNLFTTSYYIAKNRQKLFYKIKMNNINFCFSITSHLKIITIEKNVRKIYSLQEEIVFGSCPTGTQPRPCGTASEYNFSFFFKTTHTGSPLAEHNQDIFPINPANPRKSNIKNITYYPHKFLYMNFKNTQKITHRSMGLFFIKIFIILFFIFLYHDIFYKIPYLNDHEKERNVKTELYHFYTKSVSLSEEMGSIEAVPQKVKKDGSILHNIAQKPDPKKQIYKKNAPQKDTDKYIHFLMGLKNEGQ
jgi:hypothetical protein